MSRGAARRRAASVAAESRGDRAAGRALTAGTLMVAPALLLVLGFQRRWLCDDAFICLRVVEFLRAGFGPRFNLLERVEVFTNPLWVAILWLASAVGLPPATAACVLGLLCATLGVVLLQAAGMAATRARPVSLRVPLGAILLVCLPPVWDFATSGLETGLMLAWVGASAWALARLAARDPLERVGRREVALSGALVGAGVLVHPDLGCIAAVVLVALSAVLRARPRTGASRPQHHHAQWALWIGALALPFAYEIFRAGYFAALVPNSALAKEAGLAAWGRGFGYLADFVAPYLLWAPLACVAIVVVAETAARGPGGGARTQPRLSWIWLVAGVLHAAYVVRVGGDFMHARLLLPSWACLCAAVAVVALPAGRPRGLADAWRGGAAMAGVLWAVLAAVALRVPYAGGVGPRGIADERGFYTAEAARPHPVAAADFLDTPFGRAGRGYRAMAADPAAVGGALRRGAVWAPGDTTRWVLVDRADPPQARTLTRDEVRIYPLLPAIDGGVRLVASHPNIGLTGSLAGPSVHLVDRLGLSDPIGSRLLLEHRGRAGHEKLQSNAWVLARFSTAAPADRSAASVAAARAALATPALRELLDAVSQPLTPARFGANCLLAPRLTWLRLPADPVVAARVLAPARP